MKCPHCDHKRSRVIDTRESGDGIRRRRQCTSCSQRFTTYEQINTAVHIVKTDGRREPFDRIKLLNGMRVASAKRAIPVARLEGLADQIEEHVYGSGRAEIASSIVGNMVLDGLKQIDPVAYIRFATVYMDLRDLESVRAELDRLMGRA
ncbi:MAG: transcriptional repressor NrdR [Chloroflexi bacterium]|nr:transcriptional repressor NrdR [Chloroflexota bacterium]